MKIKLIKPNEFTNSESRALKILDDYDKGNFELTKEDLDKIKRVINDGRKN